MEDIASRRTRYDKDIYCDANYQGFTFLSNTPGLDSCRPDRVLVGSNDATEVDIQIIDTSRLLDYKVLIE